MPHKVLDNSTYYLGFDTKPLGFDTKPLRGMEREITVFGAMD